MKKVLVFDFGASSARAMLCSYENQQVSINEVHRFTNGGVRENGENGGNGTLYWDIEHLFDNVIKGLELGYKAGGFDAVSIDTWGVDFGLIDKDGLLIEKPVCYRDERTVNMPEKLYKIISEKDLYSRTGIQSMRINTLFQLFYIAQNKPELFLKADKLLMMPDLFSYFLCGVAKNEFTEATTSQLVNAKSGDWDFELMKMLGIPAKLFSPLIKAGEIYGNLLPEICSKANLPKKYENVPVIAAPSHDTASAVTAVPAVEEDFVFISCGTWTLFGTELKTPIISQSANKAQLTNEGGYGKTTTFLKNIMGLWLIQESRKYYNNVLGNNYSFGDLEKMAVCEKPFRSFINPNADEFSTPENMPIKIAEFCRKTNQPVPETAGQVIRCIYESLALEFAVTLEEISLLTGKNYEKIYMFGGGTKDKMLCQCTADATGKNVVAGPVEATAMGNAISSFIALGEIKDLKTARKNMAVCNEIKAFNPDEHSAWEQALIRYKNLK